MFCKHRSLSELEGLRVGVGDMGDKIRQVAERATLFRITSNAMINVNVGGEEKHVTVDCFYLFIF